MFMFREMRDRSKKANGKAGTASATTESPKDSGAHRTDAPGPDFPSGGSTEGAASPSLRESLRRAQWQETRSPWEKQEKIWRELNAHRKILEERLRVARELAAAKEEERRFGSRDVFLGATI